MKPVLLSAAWVPIVPLLAVSVGWTQAEQPPPNNDQPPAPMKKSSLVSDAPAAYEEAKSMIVGYVPGKIDEARVMCEKAGLKVADESRGSRYVVCTWEVGKLEPALTELARHPDLFEYAQPNYRLDVQLPDPAIPRPLNHAVQIAPPPRPVAKIPEVAPSPRLVTRLPHPMQ